MKDFTVEIVYGATEAYTAEQTKFMGKPEHISGETLMIDIATSDLSHLRSFGPFSWIDATLYAEHVDGKDRYVDAIAAMVDIEKRHEAARYPGNDWSGLLDNPKN